jgi:ornithine cyclodeaminase/alanine dehydrogenase-like protein (mu-crystallin family)
VTRQVLILGEADVRGALDMASCIEAVEAAFVAYSFGEAELPGVIHLDVPEARGEVHIKAGHLHGAPSYALKASSGFYLEDPPSLDGVVVVFDATNGEPEAILLDGGYLTDLRTGAAGGVAAKWLAPERVDVVGVIGTGIQASQQVAALRVVRPNIEEVRVWGRNAEHAARAAANLDAAATPTARDAVDDADVVITCTAAREPLVQLDWLKPGVHVTALGSDGVGKQELDPEILRRADVVAADSIEQCRRLGELQHARDVVDDAVELGRICSREAPGRTSPEQITVADLTGVGVQDVAAANAVLAGSEGRGRRISV